jgi:glyoxylase-like metal-dependent hydrolase (beta-lactamase superfamily II)
VFTIGSLTLQSIPTPGHTLDSFSFYIDDQVIFTGDTIFTNGVGRPDLKANPEESRQKAALLYHSLKRMMALPDGVQILPAHTSKPVDFDGKLITGTIGEIKKNIPLVNNNEDDFIATLLTKIPPTPANYLSIVEKNIKGDFSEPGSTDLEAGANRCAIS